MNSELERIEQLKHFEYILGNCIEYLWEIWNNDSTDDIRKHFERLGFNKEDLDYWYINEDLKRIYEESGAINE